MQARRRTVAVTWQGAHDVTSDGRAAGALGPAQTLSSAGAAIQPAVAVDVNRAGSAIAAWSRLDPAAYRVEASVGS